MSVTSLSLARFNDLIPASKPLKSEAGIDPLDINRNSMAARMMSTGSHRGR